MNLIDLHVHTTASDGILTPAEIVHKAEAEGLRAIAIADHDTVDGIDEAIEAAGSLLVIPSIEFSVAFKRGTFHLLGMNIDHTYEPLVKKTLELKEKRDNRSVRILEDLAKHGIHISMEEVIEEAGGGAIGRPHIARCLIRHNYGENMTEIFQNYLVKGKPGYAPKEKISINEAMKLIIKGGGIPIIAHPVSLERRGRHFIRLLEEFLELGGQGIEVYASMHSENDVAYYSKVAHNYDIMVSGGSDFHGDKDEQLGFYNEDLPIPFDLYKNFTNSSH